MPYAKLTSIGKRYRKLKKLAARLVRRYRQHASLARWGERRAARHLLRQGLWIRHVNWRSKRGELDIVAQERNTLVIVEVKTRSLHTHEVFQPEAAVDSAKQAQLVRLSLHYAKDYRLDLRRKRIRHVRHDIVAIVARQRYWGGWSTQDLRWWQGATSINIPK